MYGVGLIEQKFRFDSSFSLLLVFFFLELLLLVLCYLVSQ